MDAARKAGAFYSSYVSGTDREHLRHPVGDDAPKCTTTKPLPMVGRLLAGTASSKGKVNGIPAIVPATPFPRDKKKKKKKSKKKVRPRAKVRV